MSPLKKHTFITGGFLLALALNALISYGYRKWLHAEEACFLSLYLSLVASLVGTLVAKRLLQKAAKAKTNGGKRLEDD
jgi:membrane protein implicated in regulation of membrane protease activity